MVLRHELTDESWAVIEPLLAPPRMGRPVRDRRQVVNGILWKLSTGAAWRDLPERYGPWKTVYERFRRWSADGTWDRLLAHVQQHCDAVGSVDWTVVCVDSAAAAIPERIDQINGRIRRGESRCRLDRAAYRRRNIVERCFNKLKHNKALATRYDKLARRYQALVTIACLRLWLP
ncbi:IS5 family transposase [Streptomyces sp. NPDC008343]|uniref:IS5 family transposase n=1 Tax=Streptomyces sp. NPDC008343 TaxID=3364828 RepID=UPI0036E36839